MVLSYNWLTPLGIFESLLVAASLQDFSLCLLVRFGVLDSLPLLSTGVISCQGSPAVCLISKEPAEQFFFWARIARGAETKGLACEKYVGYRG